MVAGIVRAILRDGTSITPGRGEVALREEDEGLGTGKQRGAAYPSTPNRQCGQSPLLSRPGGWGDGSIKPAISDSIRCIAV